MNHRSLPLSAVSGGGCERGCSWSRPIARGFSLVELMIAIMILGLGLVMAATVFPVSLDVTKGTLQLNISQAAADAAAATLAIRLPSKKDLGSSSYPFLRVSRPDMWAREILSPSADLDATDMMVEGSIPLLSPPLYPQLVRFYTEWSFWNAERSGVPLSPVFPVDAQNLAPTLIPVPEMPPMPEVLGAGPSPARISIADRVYPPVDVFYPNNTMRPLYTIGNELGILNEVASRRYCWTALHYRDLAQAQDQKQNSFFCQIVLLYRSKLESRYVRQDPSTWPIEPPYPSVIPPTVKPVSSPGINDITLFPQAWMVWVHVYPDPSDPTFMDGEVICTGTVARLLPVGSYMISVDSGQLSTGASVSPGVSAKILRNSWSGDVNLDAKLQIAPGSFPIGLSRRVWVFPPAFDGTRFERVSPVVDVISKRVYTQ